MLISPDRGVARVALAALLAASALLCATGCGGGTDGIAVSTSTLTSGRDILHGIALTETRAYVVEETATGQRILAVPLTSGSSTEVATATGDIISPVAYGTGCVYIDVAEKTVNYVSSGSEPVVLNRASTAAPRACAASSGTAYWIDGAGARLISLEIATDPGASDPPPPLSFPEVLADTDGAVLLAVASDRLWIADQSGARLSQVALAGGAPVATTSSLGTIQALKASGTTVVAAGTGGFYTGGQTLAVPGSASLLGAGVVTTGTVGASTGTLFLATTGGALQRMTSATGLSGLDARGMRVVVAENTPTGGRVRLLTLPADDAS